MKVDICLDMSDAVVRVCADGIRAQNAGITDGEVLERLRERFEWSKRWQKDRRSKVFKRRL